jgi:hypothetical protein
MILQAQPKPAVATPEALLFTAGFLNDSLEPQRPIWIYRDHQGKLQGPFSASSMLQWYSTGRLPQDLLVCRVAKATAQQTALELIPASCFRPLNQLVAAAAQGVQYQPVSIAARQQPAGMQVVQALPQAAAMRPAVVGGQQQISMLPAQPVQQGAMALPAVRPAAPQLQQAFQPAGMGMQQVVQLQSAAGMVQQQPNLVMMQQQQPQQVLITSQQQAAPAMQPVMLMPQQQQMQPRPIVLQQPQALGPRPQLQQPVMQQQQQQGQPMVLQQVPAAARMAAPQQVAGGVTLQQVPQQLGSMQMPLQQQGMVRPAGVVPAGVSMPAPAMASVRPGQPMLLQQQQQQQAILQGAGAAAKPPGVALTQQQQQSPQALLAGTAAAAAPASGDAATAHVAQRLEHLAAQAHQHVRPAGPVPPISIDKLGGPASSGPTSGRLVLGPLSARSLGGGSATSSFNNLDQLVRQANAAAAASGPASAGAPAGLLPTIRTDRRSSAGGAAEPASAGGLMGLHLTPREGSMLSAGGCWAAGRVLRVVCRTQQQQQQACCGVLSAHTGHDLVWRKLCCAGTGSTCAADLAVTALTPLPPAVPSLSVFCCRLCCLA